MLVYIPYSACGRNMSLRTACNNSLVQVNVRIIVLSQISFPVRWLVASLLFCSNGKKVM